jgi:hypothetical protein
VREARSGIVRVSRSNGVTSLTLTVNLWRGGFTAPILNAVWVICYPLLKLGAGHSIRYVPREEYVKGKELEPAFEEMNLTSSSNKIIIKITTLPPPPPVVVKCFLIVL